MRNLRLTYCLSAWLFRLSGCLLVFVLFAIAAHAQSYSPMFSPSSNNGTVWVYCKDPQTHQYYYWCDINLSNYYYYGTNAHFHESSSHPKSSMSCVNYYQCSPSSGQSLVANTWTLGSVEVRIPTTLVGQAEQIYAYNAYGDARYNFAVGYTDVYYNDHPEIWMRIGGTDTGRDTGHGSTYYNRYMMTNAAYGLYYATQDYLQAHQGQSKVCTNDMALPFGGKFDIDRTWTSPHAAHDRGTAVDVAGPGSSQCPDSYEINVADFLNRCITRGALSQYSVNEGNHAHCNWAAPTSYPH